MYYTHGDTVIFRSDTPGRERIPSRRRDRAPEPEREERRQVLTDRVAQLEARLERLEAELEQARVAQAAAPPAAPGSGGGRRSRGGQGAGEVKVSLHADGGAQATVGQVRMVSDP